MMFCKLSYSANQIRVLCAMAWWSVRNVCRMGFMWTFVLVHSYFRLFLKLIFGYSAVYARCPPASHSARACIVTGASSGIGKATAEILALEGYHVILAGRSLPCLSKVVNELERKHEDVLIYAMELDLCSVPSIMAFVKKVDSWLKSQASHLSLHLLVNNAGILAASQRCTADGFDSMIMTNYLGPFILTRLLLPVLQKSSQSPRIVNVVSFTHRSARSLQIQKLLAKRNPCSDDQYKMAEMYEASKLCALLFTYQLHRKLWDGRHHSRISVMAADPGIVQTNIMRELPWLLVQFTHMVLRGLFLLQSPQCGARTVVDAALAPTEVSGKYFFGGNGFTLPSSRLSYDEKLGQQLWESSIDASEGLPLISS